MRPPGLAKGEAPRPKGQGAQGEADGHRRPAALLAAGYFEREKKIRWRLRCERADKIGMRITSLCVWRMRITS